MKYYIIAGEASGDLHASNLLKEIKKLDSSAISRGFGGDKMEAQGTVIVKHYRDLAFMGFIEVVANIRQIFRNISICKADIEVFKPDVLVLVDYPGFNLRIAEWAHKKKIPVVYYISPQVWAWKENRVKLIRRVVDRMIVILPFEKKFYRKWDYDVDYVGHPLVQVINEYRAAHPVEKANNLVAILPGSRKQEILAKLPIMLRQAKNFPDFRFVVAMAPGLENNFYEPILREFKNANIETTRDTYSLLNQSTAALVTSGTATLETALFEVPQVICYKGSAISYYIAKKLISIKFIGLVNLIMNKEVVRELIQHDLNEQNLQLELHNILNDKKVITLVKQEYHELRELLGKDGNASANAARIIIETVNRKVGGILN